MRRAFLAKAQKSFVDCRRRKKFSPIFCAGDDEVDGLAYEQELEATQALLSSFGGHRPPLQKAPIVKTSQIVLGTRGSELARAQAHLVEKAVQSAWPALKIDIKIIG